MDVDGNICFFCLTFLVSRLIFKIFAILILIFYIVQSMKTLAGENLSVTNLSSISAHQAQPNRYALCKFGVRI